MITAHVNKVVLFFNSFQTNEKVQGATTKDDWNSLKWACLNPKCAQHMELVTYSVSSVHYLCIKDLAYFGCWCIMHMPGDRKKFQRILLTIKQDENDVQKVWIRFFGVLHHQQGRYKEKLSLVHYTLTTTSPFICPVDGVAHRKIGFRRFVHHFRLAFWSIKSFETSECESRIVGRSPCYRQTLSEILNSTTSPKPASRSKILLCWRLTTLGLYVFLLTFILWRR